MPQEMEEMSWETALEGKVLLPGRGTEVRLGLSHGVVLEQQPLTSLPGFASSELCGQPVAAGAKLLPELVRLVAFVYQLLSCPCFPLIWFWELGSSSFMLLWWIMTSFFNHTVLLPAWEVRKNWTLWWLVLTNINVRLIYKTCLTWMVYPLLNYVFHHHTQVA